MAHFTKFQIVLKSNKDKTKPALIYLTYTWDRRYKLSLGVSVNPQWWDREKECAIITNLQKQQEQRNLKRLNRFLEDIKRAIRLNLDSFNTYHKHDGWVNDVSGEHVLRRMKLAIAKIKGAEEKEKEKRALTPLQYFSKVVEDMPQKIVRRTSKKIDPRTVGHHKIVLKRFESYLNYNHLLSSFVMFHKGFESDMERWMLNVEGYSSNTVAATFSVMKVWLKQAEEDGLITDKSFHSWKSKGSDVQHIYLTESELNAIYQLDFGEIVKLHPNAKYEETRDIFIIASNVGLRYGDLASLNRANWDIENKTIQVHTHKTGATVSVPLSTTVVELYKKYQGHFPIPREKGKFNAQLQKIGELAGINQTVFIKKNVGGKEVIEEKKKFQLISSHTARRSFATNLYNRCKNARMVMKFTGHTTEENFRKYICIEDAEYIEMARQYFD